MARAPLPDPIGRIRHHEQHALRWHAGPLQVSAASLHALANAHSIFSRSGGAAMPNLPAGGAAMGDRKSTRLNSSHSQISYAVFCLKKKNTSIRTNQFHHTIPI